MDVKKSVILVVAIILLIVNIYNFVLVTGIDGYITQGIASICINHPPTIESITDQNPEIDILFTLQTTASDPDNDDLTYSDNTDLFNIDQTGLISFTPTGISDAGNHSITITVSDNASCDNSEVSTSFLLTINESVTPREITPPTGGAAAAGGSSLPVISFDLSEELLKVSLKESQSLKKKIIITNNGDYDLEVTIDNSLAYAVNIIPEQIKLPKNEKKEIILIFNPNEDLQPDIYIGPISFIGTNEGTSIIKDLTLVLEVESDETLFDGSLDLIKKTLTPEDKELKATVSIFNLKRITPAEVQLVYNIIDKNNDVLYEEDEKITLKDKASFSKTIPLPENIPEGTYLLAVKILYKDSFATVTEFFTIEVPSALDATVAPIVERPALLVSILPIMLLFLVIILITLYLIYRKIRKTVLIIKKK